MAFAFITFAQATAILASRLQDPTQIYFNQPNELLNAVIESVRLFQALTGSYKQAFSFPTTANLCYYPLASQPATPVPYTVTDVEVANNVLAALLETPLITGWVGTGQFTFAQLQASLQARLNRFIGETGRDTSQQTIPAIGELNTLPDGTLDVRRAGFIPIPQVTPPANPTFPLGRLDDWAAQAYSPDASNNPGMPDSYSVYQVGPLQLRLVPPPLSAGNIDLLLTLSGPAVNLDPLNPVLLRIPDDLTPAIKWGVLADLLGTDGPSRDYARAQYCEQRYQEFVQIARIYPLVLTATVNNISCGIGSVFDMDFYQPDWQTTTGPPTFIGICGRGLACVGPTPDGVYSIGTWLCASAPVSGFIQVSRDQIDPILDYAQHIASFKMAGAEFDGTQRLYQNLIACAKSQNGRLEAIAFYKEQLEMPSRKSELEIPRMLV